MSFLLATDTVYIFYQKLHNLHYTILCFSVTEAVKTKWENWNPRDEQSWTSLLYFRDGVHHFFGTNALQSHTSPSTEEMCEAWRIREKKWKTACVVHISVYVWHWNYADMRAAEKRCQWLCASWKHAINSSYCLDVEYFFALLKFSWHLSVNHPLRPEPQPLVFTLKSFYRELTPTNE